jgi:hypothetical protein
MLISQMSLQIIFPPEAFGGVLAILILTEIRWFTILATFHVTRQVFLECESSMA